MRIKSLMDIDCKTPMDIKQSKALATAFIYDTKAPRVFNFTSINDFHVKIMEKRVTHFCPELKISDGLAYFVFVTQIDRPGLVVLWTYTLWRLFQKVKPKEYLNIQDLVDVFPNGFPTYEEWVKIWDAQKGFAQEPPVKIDNCLDYLEYWQ